MRFPWCQCRKSTFNPYNMTTKPSSEVRMCHVLHATGMCNPRKLTCCDFAVAQLDLLVSSYCLSLVKDVTVNGASVPHTKKTDKGAVLRVMLGPNTTYTAVALHPVEVCVRYSRPCACLTRYALFGSVESGCCTQGLVAR